MYKPILTITNPTTWPDPNTNPDLFTQPTNLASPFYTFWLAKWRPYWSNKRHPDNHPLGLPRLSKYQMRAFTKTLYPSFKYAYDKPSELFDAMRSPYDAYHNIMNGGTDDCDGYAAALLYMGGQFLITMIDKNPLRSHTVLWDGEVVDYTDHYPSVEAWIKAKGFEPVAMEWDQWEVEETKDA